MSDVAIAPPPPAEPRKPTGFFANLIDLYFVPAEAFANLLRRPAFVAPLLLHLALSMGLWGTWLQKVDMADFLTAQRQEAGRTDPIPADRMEVAVKWTRGAFLATAIVGPPLLVFVLSGLFLFVFRFFYESEVNFTQALTIVASSFATFALLTTPLMLGVLALKGDWTILPPEALQANLTLFLEKQTTAKWLWALGSSIDLITFWQMFVLASGFGVASKRTWSSALAGIAAPWALLVMAKVSWALLR